MSMDTIDPIEAFAEEMDRLTAEFGGTVKRHSAPVDADPSSTTAIETPSLQDLAALAEPGSQVAGTEADSPMSEGGTTPEEPPAASTPPADENEREIDETHRAMLQGGTLKNDVESFQPKPKAEPTSPKPRRTATRRKKQVLT